VAGAGWSREQGRKGALAEGQFADLAVLDRDYFACDEDEIADITSDLTMLGGEVVHASGVFSEHEPGRLPDLPGWSPVNLFGAPGAPVRP